MDPLEFPEYCPLDTGEKNILVLAQEFQGSEGRSTDYCSLCGPKCDGYRMIIEAFASLEDPAFPLF